MGYRFSTADIAVLTGPAGTAALERVSARALTTASLVGDLHWARGEFGEYAAAFVETVRLRRRAETKLSGAADWLFTDDALQQATPSRVAAHRATRLAGRAVHDVTCSIGTELAALHRMCPALIGSDLDGIRLAMAAHNLSGVDAVQLVRADALAPCSAGTVVLADPGRRADGRRTHDPAKLQPPLPALLSAYPDRDLVVKCAPGLDFDRLDWSGEVEVVSLAGSVREACLWSPGLGEPGIRRRASVLGADGSVRTVTDAGDDELPERAPGAWIIDPDGAVVRAGLVRHYGAAHGLWQLDPRIAYLTGDSVPTGVRGFRILDRLELREKALRSALRRRDCGPLEILVRGVDIDPDALRSRLKPVGSRPHTLVITRIGRAAVVFVCATPPAAARSDDAELVAPQPDSAV